MPRTIALLPLTAAYIARVLTAHRVCMRISDTLAPVSFLFTLVSSSPLQCFLRGNLFEGLGTRIFRFLVNIVQASSFR